MSKYENLLDIAEEIEGLLDLLFIGGLYSIQKDIIEKLNHEAGKAGDYGLEYGAKLICRIAEGLEARRHSADYDFTLLSDDCYRLSLYISFLKNGIQMKRVEELLLNTEQH